MHGLEVNLASHGMRLRRHRKAEAVGNATLEPFLPLPLKQSAASELPTFVRSPSFGWSNQFGT
jgi:hypothetical protein